MKSDDPSRDLGILLHEVTRLLRRNFDRRVADLGLTQAQWRALFYLKRNEGCNQAFLAEQLEVKPITLARLVDRLEASNWVERRRDPADRRACRLYLTAGVKPLITELEQLGAETRCDALAGLSLSEQSQVIGLLNTLKTNLLEAEAQHVEAPARDGNEHE